MPSLVAAGVLQSHLGRGLKSMGEADVDGRARNASAGWGGWEPCVCVEVSAG